MIIIVVVVMDPIRRRHQTLIGAMHDEMVRLHVQLLLMVDKQLLLLLLLLLGLQMVHVMVMMM